MLVREEVLLKIQTKNNRLHKLIAGKWTCKGGKLNVAAFCRELSLSLGIVCDLLYLRRSPVYEADTRHGRIGEYILTARKIAEYFDVSVDVLFPLNLYARVVKSAMTKQITLAQLPYVQKMVIAHMQGDNNETVAEGILIPVLAINNPIGGKI